MELHLSDVQPPKVLLAAKTRFEAAAEERGLGLELDLPASLSAVTGDEERTPQVLANLLSNALKHTPSGGQVTLSGEGSVFTFTLLAAQPR